MNRLQRLEKAFEGVEWVLLLAIKSLGLGMSTSAGSTQGVNTVVTKIGTSHPPMFPVTTVTQIINNIEIPHQNSGSLMLGVCKPMETGVGSCGNGTAGH